MATRRASTRMISIRLADGPLAKAESFCVPVECFTASGEFAILRLEAALPPGSPAGTPIPRHEYRIDAAALTAPRGGSKWMLRGPALAYWVRHAEDWHVVEGRWYRTGGTRDAG